MKNNNLHNNPLFIQYMREYQRLTQVFRRMEKKGYIVPEEIKPEKPSKLKTVTQSDVNWLIQLTPKEIRERSYYVDPSTGKRTLGLDVVKSHHKAKPSIQKARVPTGRSKGETQPTINTNKKSNDGDIPPKENNLNMQIIDDISDMLERWQPAYHWNSTWVERKTGFYFSIYKAWSDAIATEGAYALAYRLENKAYYYHRLIDRVIHASDSIWDDQMNVNEIISFLLGRSLTAEESDQISSSAHEYLQDRLIGDSFG